MHIYAFCMHNHKLQHAFLLLLLLEVFLAMNAKKVVWGGEGATPPLKKNIYIYIFFIFDDQASNLFAHFFFGGGDAPPFEG